MKVSFLVTFYNQKEYIRQCLDSIFNIDFKCDYEVLIGDDGSSDGSIDLIKEYMHKYSNIKLFTMPRDNTKQYDPVLRASANRLNLLENSSGDLFCTLDGDDFYCDASFINEAIDIFNKHDDVAVVSFGYKYYQDNKYTSEYTLPLEYTNNYMDKYLYISKDYYVPAGACVHKKLFNKDRIDYLKKLKHFDDNDILINTLMYGKMYVVNRPIYAYRQTGTSIYTSMNELEKALLNVSQMDVNLRIVTDEYKDAILKRRAYFVSYMYIYRKDLIKVLGKEKINKYVEVCRNYIPSYCLDIINYKSLTRQRRKEIYKIMNYRYKQVIKIYLKKIL